MDITLTGQDPAYYGWLSTLTYSVVSGVSHGTLVAINADTYRYRPGTNFNGTDSFTFKVNNGEIDGAPATVSITVGEVNDLPEAADISLTTAEDAEVTIPASFTDVDGGPIASVQIVSQPAHGSVELSGTNFLYLPATNYYGTDSFTYHVTDGWGYGNTATVFVTVTNVQDAPLAHSQSVTASEDTSTPITLTASEVDGDPITFSVFTSPAHGTLTGTPPDLVYTPAANYFGSDGFVFSVSDGTANSTATVSITVTPVNDLPLVNGLRRRIFDGVVNLWWNAVPGAVTYNVYRSDETNGLYAIIASGLVTTNYSDAAALFQRNYHYYITTSDGASESAASNPVFARPDDMGVVNLNQPLWLLRAFSAQVQFCYSMITGAEGLWEYGATTNYGVTLEITNLLGCQHFTMSNLTPQTVYYYRLTVTDSNGNAIVYANSLVTDGAPVADAQGVSVAEDNALNVTVTGHNANYGPYPLTYALLSSAAHGTVTSTGPNTFRYQPATNYNGADSFTFTVNNGELDSAPATVSITVTPVNDLPTVANISHTTVEDTIATIPASITDVDGGTLVFVEIVSQPAHGSAGVSGTNLMYLPATNYFGADSFTYRVSDGYGFGNTATVFITVTNVEDSPIAFAQSVSTAEDVNKAITLAGVDPDGDSIVLSILASPAHGTLVGTPPNVTYRPATNYNGADSFTFRAYDGTSFSAPATVSITVTPVNDRPVANSQSVTVAEDGSISITPTGSDVDPEGLTFVIVTPPAHGSILALGPTTWGYTPAANYNGADSFTFVARDAVTSSAPATISITVTPVNDAPVAQNNSFTLSEDGVLYSGIGGTDPENDPLTYRVTTPPAHGTLTITGTSSNGFIYRGFTNYTGPDSFQFVANDGQLDSSPATISLTITPVNDMPSVTNQSVTLAEDTVASIVPLADDVDGDALTFTIFTAPSHGTAVVSGGNLIYTPNTNFNGADSFEYQAHDPNGGANTATVSLNVQPVNDPPIANAQNTGLAEDGSRNILLKGTDIDGDVLSFAIVTGPAHGTLSGTPPNVVYTPQANYNGPDSFTFSASDAEASSIATVSITVTAVNDPPVAPAQAVTTDEDMATTFALLASDVDGDALTVTLVVQAGHGVVTFSGTNCTYRPFTNYNGSDAFTYQARDPWGTTANGVVSVTINPVNDVPVTTNRTFSVNEDTALTMSLGGNDVDGDVLTPRILSQPTNGVVTGTGPTFVYLANTNFNCVDHFTYVVNDGTSDGNVGTVTINVNAVDDLPIAIAQTLTTDEDVALNFALQGNDPDNTFYFTVDSLPAHGGLSGIPPNLHYTPNANFNGTDSFVCGVDDNRGHRTTNVVTLIVRPVNDAPVTVNKSATTPEDTTATIDVTGTDVDGDALTYSIVTPPAHGVATVNGANVIYTPATNYNGSDSFTYRANDGAANGNVSTVTITVTAVNDAPTASSQSVTTDEDTAIGITFQAVDLETNSIFYAIVTPPAHGTLTGVNGSRTYTPVANYNGPDSFTFVAYDQWATGDVATVTITVRAVNDAPVANTQSVTTDEDTATPIVLTATDADGDVLSYTVLTTPTHGSLSGTAPNLTYTPAANYFGTDGFTFRVNDGAVNSGTATVSITVFSVNDAPVANAQSVTVTYNTAKAITLTGSDLEGGALTYAIVSGPTNGALSGTAPNVTYTPTAGSAGVDFFTFRVNDGSSNSAAATVSLTTLNPTGIPSAPSGLNITVPTALGTLILIWNCSATNEDGFEIERSLNSGSGWSEIATTGINIHTFTNTGLTSGTRYYYRVRSYNRLGNSAYSNTKDARPR